MEKEILKFVWKKKMSKDKKYSKSSLEDFLRYLDGNLSDRERNRIERNLMRDPFEGEAMEGLSGKATREIREDIDMIDRQIGKRVSVKRSFTWYRVAAIIAILLAISITFITVFDDRIGQLSRRVADTETQPAEEKMEESLTGGDLQTDQQERAIQPEIPESEAAQAVEQVIQSVPPPAIEETQDQVTEIAGIIAEETEEILADDLLDEFALETETREEVMAMEAGEIVITEDEALGEADMDVVERDDAPAAIAAQPLAASKARMMEMTAGELTEGPGLRTISGTVVSSEDDRPLRGVSIMVKGTPTSVVSDMGGNFSIPLSSDSDNTLVADFIGMESREVSIGDQTEMEIILQPDLSSRDDVVLVDPGEGNTFQPAGFEEYIEMNISFPEGSDLIRATVILSFTIGPDGRPDDITVLSSPDISFSNEAVRLLNEGPDWDPPAREAESGQHSTLLRILFMKNNP
jgi:hypothetical protein